MIRTIIQKEWTEYKEDSRVKWMTILLYALYAIALFTGISYYTSVSKNSAAAQEESYNQWLRQGKKNPHGAAHYGFYAYKPLSPMAILDKGMESYLGQAVWLEAHNQNEVKEREATDAGSIVRFGYLSVGFVFQFLFPLAILLLGFNVFSKEREWGTWPLLASSGASVRQIFKGKAAALYGIVLLIFLPLLFVSCISMLVTAGVSQWMAVMPRFILFAFFCLLHYAIWVLLSLYISSSVTASSVSLVALLGFWIVGTFFIPRAGSVLSKAVYPTPSSFQFSHSIRLDKELGLDGKTPASLRQKKFEDSLLTRYKVASVNNLPISIRGLNLKRGEEYGYLIFEKAYGGLEKIYRSQDRLMNWLNFLSPAQSMRSISAGTCGTDINKHILFAAQAEAHRRLIATTMNEDITMNAAGVETYEGDEKLWKKIPPFKYEEASIMQTLKPQLIPILSLVIWLSVMLFMLNIRAGKISGL